MSLIPYKQKRLGRPVKNGIRFSENVRIETYKRLNFKKRHSAALTVKVSLVFA